MYIQGKFSAGNINYNFQEVRIYMDTRKWQVVADNGEIRRVVGNFTTVGGYYDKSVQGKMDDVIKYFSTLHPDDKIYVREPGSSIYRLVVELNGTKEYVKVEDDMPISAILEHIYEVRETYRCYDLPTRIWLEQNIYGVWVVYF